MIPNVYPFAKAQPSYDSRQPSQCCLYTAMTTKLYCLVTILICYTATIVSGVEVQYYRDVNCTKATECDYSTMCYDDGVYNCNITWDGTVDTDDLTDCDCDCSDIDTVTQAEAEGATCLSDGACFLICNDSGGDKGIRYVQDLNGVPLNAALLSFDNSGAPEYPCDVGEDDAGCLWLYTNSTGDGIGDGDGGDSASTLHWLW